jgi:hypothetical protein
VGEGVDRDVRRSGCTRDAGRGSGGVTIRRGGGRGGSGVGLEGGLNEAGEDICNEEFADRY